MRHAAIKNALDFQFESDEHAVLVFWTAKILQSSFVHKKLLKLDRAIGQRRHIGNLEIILGINLEEFDDDQAYLMLHEASKHFLHQTNQQSLKFPREMQANLKKIARLLELNEVEVAILRFFVLLRANRTFLYVTAMAEDLNRRQVIELMCWILDVPYTKMERAFSRHGTLYTTGLIRIDPDGVNELHRKVDVMDRVIDHVMANSVATDEFLSAFCMLSSPSALNTENYPHLKSEFEQLVSYLAENRHKGINVLVYGPPGTGKTQWVKLIANTLNQNLYEISAEDSEGEAVGPSNRIGLYQLTQRAFNSQKDALVLFDEVEDVFPSGPVMSFSPRGRDRVSKSWLNTLLEENPVPAFWVSNRVNQIDPAYIRRFDFVVEVPVPPRSVRLNMLEDAFDGLPVTQDWLKSLAESRVLSPALIDQVAQVVKRSTSFKQKPSSELETLILDRINATLAAQGKRKIQLKPPKPMHYSTELINTTVDMDQLVEGLKISQAGRLCLYGYPGTGKTEFGHYLSEQLDRPLVKKRASDLLSPYVGESEQNIASAFEEARNEGAILQVDEADSFLQNREDAKRSWEVTQVNELLTQMESFEGVFIATTNLINRLDQASIRRFDWKLEFKPLTNHQAWLLFKECFGHNPKDKPQKEIQSALRQLNALTPGDFAVVSRKLKFLQSTPDASYILNMLEEEHQHKPSSQQSKGMGFLSPVV